MYEPLPTPLADHMTADLPIVADFTAIDGTTYHRLELIIKRKQGSASVYCAWHSLPWPITRSPSLKPWTPAPTAASVIATSGACSIR